MIISRQLHGRAFCFCFCRRLQVCQLALACFQFRLFFPGLLGLCFLGQVEVEHYLVLVPVVEQGRDVVVLGGYAFKPVRHALLRRDDVVFA